MWAKVAVTMADPKLIATTNTTQKTYILKDSFLYASHMMADAMTNTPIRVNNTTEKSTSLKKSMARKRAIPKRVRKVTSLSDMRLDGWTNCSYLASCFLSNFQI